MFNFRKKKEVVMSEAGKSNVNTVDKLREKKEALEKEFEAIGKERETLVATLSQKDARLREIKAQHDLLVDLLPKG